MQIQQGKQSEDHNEHEIRHFLERRVTGLVCLTAEFVAHESFHFHVFFLSFFPPKAGQCDDVQYIRGQYFPLPFTSPALKLLHVLSINRYG